jgi:hypothetical protein
VIGLPSVTIDSPADHQTFNLNQVVAASFTCSDATNPAGPGITACTDSAGGSGSAGRLDTSTTGPHTYTVTATSHDGLTASSTIHYTVAGPPTVMLSSQAAGATFRRGQSVLAGYACQDDPNGPGITTCSGTVANGTAINTGAVGPHSFTVTAISADGQVTTRVVQYTVSDSFFSAILGAPPSGVITLEVTVPSAGKLYILETDAYLQFARTARARVLVPGPGRFAYAKAHRNIKKAGTYTIVMTLTALGRRIVANHRGPLVINVWARFTPRHGRTVTRAFIGDGAVVIKTR